MLYLPIDSTENQIIEHVTVNDAFYCEFNCKIAHFTAKHCVISATWSRAPVANLRQFVTEHGNILIKHWYYKTKNLILR